MFPLKTWFVPTWFKLRRLPGCWWKRGVITPEELIDEVKVVHAEQHKKAGGVGIS